jgi:hypothetical protein
MLTMRCVRLKRINKCEHSKEVHHFLMNGVEAQSAIQFYFSV